MKRIKNFALKFAQNGVSYLFLNIKYVLLNNVCVEMC